MIRKEKFLLFILASINFTHIMDFMILMPLQEYLVPDFHITPKEFSWLVSVYAFSAGLSSLTASFIVDRFDRKKVLLFAYIGFVIGTWSCAFAPTYSLLILARIVAGVFGGLIGAQVMAIVGDTFPFEKRGAAMGLLMAAFSFAAVIGVPLGLFLASHYTWHIPFVMVGSMGILLIPLIVYGIPEMRSHLTKGIEQKALDIYRSIFSNRNQQYGLLMMLTLIVAHFSIIPFIAPYLENNVGFTKQQVAIMYMVGGIVSLISSPIIGKLADKYGKYKMLSLFLILSIIPVFGITNMPRIPFYYVLVVTALFFIFAGGRMIPAQALITSVVPPQLRGGFMNVNASLQQIGIGFAAIMAGAIVSKNSLNELIHYQYVGYIGMAISLLCLFIAGKVKPMDTSIKK